MSEMISFGGGVNSVAMTVMLVEQGWRGPVVFADTGAERPATYCYMDYFEREYLTPRGLRVIRLLPGSVFHRPWLINQQVARFLELEESEAFIPLEDYCLKIGIIPLLSVRWCSIRWKRKPIIAWRLTHGIEHDLIAISADEPPRRVRYDDPSKRYPLVDEEITRAGCVRIIQGAGLELPGKSSCFFCPGQTLPEWRDLYLNLPELYERAARMEDVATANRRNGSTASIYMDGRTLRELAAQKWQGAMEMDLSDWLPCVCRL